MSEYNAKNYTEQGGEKTVIGGTLEIQEGASVTGLPSSQVPVATETTLGGVKATTKTETYTVAAKIGTDGNLYCYLPDAAVEYAWLAWRRQL